MARWLIATALAAGTLLAARPAVRAAVPHTLPHNIYLIASPVSTQPVGTRITWHAYAHDSVPLVYQFSVAASAQGPYTILRDFSPTNSFIWTPLQEGLYWINVTIKEGFDGAATASEATAFAVTSRVNGAQAVITHLRNPLVALYSAPPCGAGTVMVAFQPQGSRRWTDTNSLPCVSGLSRNFLIAGLYPQTTYNVAEVIVNAGVAVTSTARQYTTGALTTLLTYPIVSVPQAPGPQSDTQEPIIFHDLSAATGGEVNPSATDLSGNLLWYTFQPDLHSVFALRIQQVGGDMGQEILLTGSTSVTSQDDQVLRLIDLAGDPVQETSVPAINHQLKAQGKRIIYGFSHDARFLPNGDIATLGFTQRVITSTAVMGDMLLVLDRNLQVVWTWDAFQHLDPNRGPTLNDTCRIYTTCPVPGGPNTIDWTHTNAIDYSPADGDLILSVRNQDWVIKINYANGSGDGSVLWRLGRQGDFSIVPLDPHDPFPWFSHQHDANFLDGTTLAVFDNANTRCAVEPAPCDSRGQVYQIDEQNKTARQAVNADLGNFSPALGTAQRLSNGNFNFTSGSQTLPPPPYGQDIEVLPDGTKVFVQQINTSEYRAWRLASMYGPTNPPCPGC